MNHTSRRAFMSAGATLSFAWKAAALCDDDNPTIPGLAAWENHMVQAGRKHAEWLIENQDVSAIDPPLAATYYDATRVFYQIADYTGDSWWKEAAAASAHVYGERYVLKNNGNVPGYWIFPHGLAMHYQRTKNSNAKEAVLRLAENAAYARDTTSEDATLNPGLSREVAYSINALLAAESLGAAPRKRLRMLVEHALIHLNKWFVAREDVEFQPFMFGLTAEALITYYTKNPDPRIPEALQRGADFIWSLGWVPEGAGFQLLYSPRAKSVSKASPDVSQLIAPIYAWLYKETKLRRFRDRGDEIFAGGVAGAWLDGPKQFNQSYRWSFDYLRWRGVERDSTSRKPGSQRTPAKNGVRSFRRN